MSQKCVQELPRDEEDSALLLCVDGPAWNIISVAFLWVFGLLEVRASLI
jgi:hypothetical protein